MSASSWLVGEAPSRAVVDKPDLWLLPDESGVPHTANRLLALTGWTLPQFLMVFDHRTYLWHTPMRLWMDLGRQNARKIAAQAGTDGSIVILGSSAAAAFQLEGSEPFTWIGRYALLPYPPGGRSSFWKAPDSKERARAFFSELLERRTAAAS